MATIDLGKIKQVWRGTYNNGTAYTVDDLVAYTDTVGGLQNTSTYICVTNSTGNAPASGGSIHASWNLVAQGVPDRLPSQSGQAGKFLTTDGTSLSYDLAGKVAQIKHLKHTTRATPTGTGTYLNWGSFTKLHGSSTDLLMSGIIWAHQTFGNNVGNPAIVWNGNSEYHSWSRQYTSSSYQVGFSFHMRFTGKSAGTSDVTWYVPSDDHRWQSVINPSQSDSGVSGRYPSGTASVCTIIEVFV